MSPVSIEPNCNGHIFTGEIAFGVLMLSTVTIGIISRGEWVESALLVRRLSGQSEFLAGPRVPMLQYTSLALSKKDRV